MALCCRLFLLAVLAAVLSAAPGAAAGPGSTIADVRLSRGAEDDLVLGFRVDQAMDQRIVDTLESGLAVRFTYWVKVVRPRRFLPDQDLVDLRLERILEKDNLADRYRLTLEEARPTREVTDLSAAVAMMSRVDDLKLLPLEQLDGRRPLQLRLRARLQRFELPFRLHYVLPFLSYLDVETDWFEQELPTADGVSP